MRLITLMLMGSVLVLSGCKKEQSYYPKEDAVAQVNNVAITKSYFNKKFDAIKALLKDAQNTEAVDDAAIKKGLLDQLIRTELLAQEAKKQGFDKEQDFQETIQSIERDLLAQAMYAKLLKSVMVTTDQVQRFYDENKEGLKEPVKIKVREIVTRTNTEAKDVFSKVMQGESFAGLAQQYSIADTKNKGGDVGFLSSGDDLRNVKFQKYLNMAFSLEKGEVSPIFQGTDDRYYIIKVDDKTGGTVKQLSELEPQIREYLQRTEENKIIEKEIKRIETTSKIVKNEDLIK